MPLSGSTGRSRRRSSSSSSSSSRRPSLAELAAATAMLLALAPSGALTSPTGANQPGALPPVAELGDTVRRIGNRVVDKISDIRRNATAFIDTARNGNECSPLPASAVCPAWAQVGVQFSQDQRNGFLRRFAGVPASASVTQVPSEEVVQKTNVPREAVTTQQEFDRIMLESFVRQREVFFSHALGCTFNAQVPIRYWTSFLCAWQFNFQANQNQCNTQARSTPMCSADVREFMRSVETAIRNGQCISTTNNQPAFPTIAQLESAIRNLEPAIFLEGLGAGAGGNAPPSPPAPQPPTQPSPVPAPEPPQAPPPQEPETEPELEEPEQPEEPTPAPAPPVRQPDQPVTAPPPPPQRAPPPGAASPSPPSQGRQRGRNNDTSDDDSGNEADSDSDADNLTSPRKLRRRDAGPAKVARLRRRGRQSLARRQAAPGQCVSADANESGFGFCGWETRDAACANNCRAPGLNCGTRGGDRVVDSPPSSPTTTTTSTRVSAQPISGTPAAPSNGASASTTSTTTTTPAPGAAAPGSTTSIAVGEAVQAPGQATGLPSDTSDGIDSSEDELKKVQAQADSALRSQRMVSTGIGVGASVIVVSMAVGALVYVRRRREARKDRKMNPSQFANLDPALGPQETKRRLSSASVDGGVGPGSTALPYQPAPPLVQQPSQQPLNTFNNLAPPSAPAPIVYNDPSAPPPMYATDPRPPSLGYPARRDSVSAFSEPSYVPPPMTFASSLPNTPPVLPPIGTTSDISSLSSTLGTGLRRNSRGAASVRSTGTFVRPQRTSIPAGMELPNAPSSGTPTGYAAVGIERFEPEMNDEMAIDVGERINVVTEYLDGWAAGFGLGGKKGVFPLACVERL